MRGRHPHQRGVQVVLSGRRAQAFGGKHDVGRDPEQRVVFLGRPVGIEHDGNAAVARGLADRPHEIGKPVVGEQQCDAGQQGIEIGRLRRFDAAVAIRHDDPLAGRIDHDARHRDCRAGDTHDACGIDAFLLHRCDQLIAGIVGFVAERAAVARAAAEPRHRDRCVYRATSAHGEEIVSHRFAARRRKFVHPKQQVLHRDARAQHGGGFASARRGHGRSRPNRG